MKQLRRILLILLALGLSPFAVTSLAFAQAVTPEFRGAPQDWSHRHLIYSHAQSRDDAVRKGTLAFEEWKKKSLDPRYAVQAARRGQLTRPTAQSPFTPEQLKWANRFTRVPPSPREDITRDWAVSLGVSGVGSPGVFPAKFSFDIDAAPSCANDFVVYTTAASGASAPPTGTAASRTGSFTGNVTAGQTATITNGAQSIVLVAAGNNTGVNFQRSNNTTTIASNLAAAIVRNGGTVGVTATSAGAAVTVTATTPGSGGNSITLAEGLNNFTWGGTTLVGGADPVGQPTIVAFRNLYKTTCGAAVPTAYWSYSTGTGAFTETSPVLSWQGDQVAFVQRTGSVASLVVLKWSGTASVGTVAAPTAPLSVAAASYRACAAPCMTVMAFNGNPNNTNSAPYYDYTNDVLYVGDATGKLHKFTGVFNGTPAEAGAPWPVTVSTNNMLSSPVYDSATGLVFVGSDTNTNLTGGQLHSVCATPPVPANTVCTAAGVVVSSSQLAAYTIVASGLKTTGVRDGPIVDSTAQRIYVFVESDTNATCGGVNCKAVFQFRTDSPINSASNGNGVGLARANVGRGQIGTRILYAGAFDNDYYDYATGTEASPTGNLYVCGALPSGTDSKKPVLWRIPITSNVMSTTPVVGPTLVTVANPNGIDANTADCSPVTEVMNGANEYIYVSVSALGNKTGCAGSCVYMLRTVSAGAAVPWTTTTPVVAGLPAPGGTSGIVVDNISSTTGASQIYYSTLTSPGNAVQASQAALQ